MSHKWKLVVSCLMVLSVLATLCLGCAEEEEEGRVTIVIGHPTDLTGPASPSTVVHIEYLDYLIRYINEEDPIPGAKLEMLYYDTKYDPAREIPGYDWLRDRGAQVIMSFIPTTGEILKPFAQRDKIPILSAVPTTPMIDPPGWVFCANTPGRYSIKTLLDWVSENDWDYAQGIPKIGLVGWLEPYQLDISSAVAEYCIDHPDQFQFVAAPLTPMGVLTWSGEIELLGDCDYVVPPSTGIGTTTFINQFRDAGWNGRFLCTDAITAFMGMVVDACGRESMEGSHGWARGPFFNYPSPIVDLYEEVVNMYAPDKAAEGYFDQAGGVITFGNFLWFMDLIRAAIEEVGADNFDGEALYNTAISFKKTYEGHPEEGYSETERFIPKHTMIWRWNAEADTLRETMTTVSGFLPLVE